MSDIETKTSIDPWSEVGWKSHEIAQLKRSAAWSFAQKIEWLEEAHLLALSFAKQREQMREGDSRDKLQ